ncbi:flavoprotein [Streptomyces sp. BE147]|uniref:flavoprotein n=1 Tax=Streptomyces sp. BE147 TaxID=3002524 RepID=UPI002E7A51F6|nr:flavoprotein [Streptomyces sp. BE147]MEE1736993.1 flavoprotein [Streptomyces sp. BE147]
MSRRLLLGVTGSSAADEVPALVAEASDLGWTVRIVATDTALRFMPTVPVQVFTNADWQDRQQPLHLQLLDESDEFLIAPATANTLAATAHGTAGTLLTALVLSRRPAHFWPTMNTRMWNSPAVQRNVHQLIQDGHHVLTPDPTVALTSDAPNTAVGPIPGTALPQLTRCCHRP